MPIASRNSFKLYETLDEIRQSEPYAIEEADVLSRVISYFIAWAQITAANPELAARFYDPTAHIRQVTELRKALKFSQENRLYPNIVLPKRKYFSIKFLEIISQSIGSELAEINEQEDKR